jgi:hypothetical protein
VADAAVAVTAMGLMMSDFRSCMDDEAYARTACAPMFEALVR